MPTNLYGPGDYFHPENSHVLPALIRRFHEAKLAGASAVTIWGSGRPRREFLHVDDLADALIFLAKNYRDGDIVNVGSGQEVTIGRLAEIVREAVGYQGDLIYDKSKPDGTPRKLLDTTKLSALGWSAHTDLGAGVREAYHWFTSHSGDFRA
jgi:GDP-L-fucose synthase